MQRGRGIPPPSLSGTPRSLFKEVDFRSSSGKPVASIPSLTPSSSLNQVAMLFKNKWSDQLEGAVGPYHRALAIIRDQKIDGEYLFSTPSLETLESILETEFKFHPAPAESVALSIFQMKGDEQQRDKTKTDLLRAHKELGSSLLTMPTQTKANWAFEKTFQLNGAINAAKDLIASNIEEYWENPNDINRKPKERPDKRRFLTEGAITASSGGGKTHFLDVLYHHLRDTTTPFSYLPIYISFHSETEYDHEMESGFDPFLSRIVFEILYHKEGEQEAAWKNYYPKIVQDFRNVEIGELFEALGEVARANKRFIVLLVDEITKFYHGTDSDVFRPRYQAITNACRTEGITAVWTTFDDYEKKTNTSGSERPLCWIPLSLFSTETVDEICKSLGDLFATEPHVRFVISLLGGHPRSIEHLKKVLTGQEGESHCSGLSYPEASRLLFSALGNSLWNKGNPWMSVLTKKDLNTILEVFAFGRTDEQYKWSDLIHKKSTIKWETLVSRGLLLNLPDTKTVEGDFIFNPILLNLAVSAVRSKLSFLFRHIYNMLQTARIDGDCLEKFHIAFECLRHTLLAKRKQSFTLGTYYGGRPFYCNKKTAQTYTFIPTRMDIPSRMDSLIDLYSFLSRRSGARLAQRGQPGFDSALWTSAYKQGANEKTTVLFLFENMPSEKDDMHVNPTELSRKVARIKQVIFGYNNWVKVSSPTSPRLKEKDVVVVFPVLRSVPRKPGKAFKWRGTVLALDRKFLITDFYKSMSPFFQALPPLDLEADAVNDKSLLIKLFKAKGLPHFGTKSELVDRLYGTKSEDELREICRSKRILDLGDKAALIRRLNPIPYEEEL